MCGIAGLVEAPGTPVDRVSLEAMQGILRHRGPDAEGLYIDGNFGLAHRRLTIIDTSAEANQPLFNEDRSVVVIYNGEIYNFQEVAERLRRADHRFRTRSDTEVIVHAWEEYGAECLDHFRGMFAFALYDAGQGKLFLARDRLGKKPLYYVSTPTRFAFASEIKALRLLPDVSSELETQALGEYAAYGNTLGERSIYRDIRRLPPAHCLTLDLNQDRLSPQIERYWKVEIEPEEGLGEGEWLDLLDRELSEAVRLRLISDVPLGAFLSGGIDSSLVVAYMAQHSSAPVKTFTMGFGEASHDESRYARAVADHFATQHHEQTVTPDAVGILERLVKVYDEPFADESAIPTFYLSQITREKVKVALSGDGGDESFLGYNRYPYSDVGVRLGRWLTPWGRRGLRLLAKRLPWSSRLKRPLDRISRTGFEHYHHAMGYSEELLGILRPEIRSRLQLGEKGKMARDFAACASRERVARYAYTDLLNYLPDDVLVKVDRASMHHSLEVRCPLLDHKVVELAARIPARLKLRGLRGKTILRRLLNRQMSEPLVERPKMGFGVPLVNWFRGELTPMLDNMVADRSSPTWRYLDRSAVETRLRAHQRGASDLHASLWRALYFHRWSGSHLS